MSDRPDEHGPSGGEADPALTSALRSMEPPLHGERFWDRLEDRKAAEPAAPAPVPPIPLVEPVEPPPPPPLAEVVPMAAPRRPGAQRWWAMAAAVVVVVLGATALVRTTSTDVTTTPAASTALPVEPSTSAPVTTAPEPPTTTALAAPDGIPAPTSTVKPSVPTAAPRRPATTRPDALVLSLDGVGPIRLGMTIQQAVATGGIGRYEDVSGTGTCGIGHSMGTYRTTDFQALFLDGKLARIYAEEGSRLRTPQGVGIGSPSSTLRSVPGTRVEEPNPYGAGTNVLLSDGGAGYLFTVDQGTVRAWSVGTTEGLRLSEACS